MFPALEILTPAALADPEVHQPDFSQPVNVNVLRLDVPVNYLARVDVFQGPSRLTRDPQPLGNVPRPTAFDRRPQAFALDELHHHVRTNLPALDDVFAKIVDGNDVFVLDVGRQPRFLQESLPSVRIGHRLFRQQLNGNTAPQHGVRSPVDVRHSPPPRNSST